MFFPKFLYTLTIEPRVTKDENARQRYLQRPPNFKMLEAKRTVLIAFNTCNCIFGRFIFMGHPFWTGRTVHFYPSSQIYPGTFLFHSCGLTFATKDLEHLILLA